MQIVTLEPNCCHKVGSTQLSRIFLYVGALKFMFSGIKGQAKPNNFEGVATYF